MTPSQSPRQPPLLRWTGPRRHAARIRSLHSLFWPTRLGLPLRDQIIEALWRQATIQPSVNHCRRGTGAVAEAEDRLERERAVLGGYMEMHTHATLGRHGQHYVPPAL